MLRSRTGDYFLHRSWMAAVEGNLRCSDGTQPHIPPPPPTFSKVQHLTYLFYLMVGRSSIFFHCCIFPLLNFAHRLWYLEIRLWLPLLHP